MFSAGGCRLRLKGQRDSATILQVLGFSSRVHPHKLQMQSRSIFAAIIVAFCVAAALPFRLTADDNIAALIAELGADSFRQREKAGHQLVAVGESALPALRTAATSHADLEIRYRAKRLVDRVMQNAVRSTSTGMVFSLIEPGEFTMGAPPNEAGRRDDERPHRVAIDQAFLLGKFEVTQDEYRRVMQANPSWFSPEGEGRVKLGDKPSGRFAVESVTWFDAIEFCNRLSKLDGLPPYYELQGKRRQNGHLIAAQVKVADGLGYRLPTEAEWEFACRAGGTGPYHAVAEKKPMRGNFQFRTFVLYGARVKVAGLSRTTNVGSYPENLWGLHDMHGNVTEWVWDWYNAGYYAASPKKNPSGPPSGHHRVLRGGSWLVQQSSCRCATRFYQVPGEGKYFTGFRVARTASRFLHATK